MENPEPPKPPEPRTRRACQAQKEAKRLEEQRFQDECPFVMMVGANEEVRQRTADKEHDEGRRQLDALNRALFGEGDGGNVTVKEEVVEDEEEGPDDARQEQDSPQSEETGEGDAVVKEEVSEGEEEEELEANPTSKDILPGGFNMAIDANLLGALELKEEDIGAGTLVVSEDADEIWWAEQGLILIDDDDDELMAEDEVEGDEDADQVINGGEGNGDGGEAGQDDVLPDMEFVKSVHNKNVEMELDEDVGEGGVERSKKTTNCRESEGAAGKNILLEDLDKGSNDVEAVEEATGGDIEDVRGEGEQGGIEKNRRKSSISHQAVEVEADAESGMVISDQQGCKITKGTDASESIAIEDPIKESVAIVDQQRHENIKGTLGVSGKDLDKCNRYVYWHKHFNELLL